MTPDEAYERGKKDYHAGVPRVAAPTPPNSEPGDSWRRGWDEESEKDLDEPDDEIVSVPVELRKIGDRFYLTDTYGRVLGMQTDLVFHQGSDNPDSGVDFTVQINVTNVKFVV